MKKRLLSLVLAAVMALSLLPAAALAAGTAAVPSPTKLIVNGKSVAADTYLIEQNNYIKLRDLATMINGTPKNFEVKWDGPKNAINLLSKTPYTPAKGDMTTGDGQSKTAALSTSAIYVDGVQKQLTAYAIGGNNYFKLRDVMETFDVYVGWDGPSGTATLDTTKGYEKPAAPAAPAANLTIKQVSGQGMDSDNRLLHDYLRGTSTFALIELQRWASPVTSHLVQTADGGFMRVEQKSTVANVADSLVVEYYDKNYNFLSQAYIENELPLYGGFYAGKDNYFLLFGQENDAEDNARETFRLVKYDKSWNRLGQTSFSDTFTTLPFRSSTASMTQVGGSLYIHTAHQMCTTEDGLRHQSNISFSVDIATMARTGMSNYLTALRQHDGYYAGHSFNQLIAAKDGILVTADQSDAYPTRAMQLSKRNLADISKSNTRASFLPFAGEIGENFTAAQLGGLAIGSTAILTAGTTADQSTFDANKRDQFHHNLYLSITPRNNMASGTKITYLTDYPKGQVAASNPFLVDLGNDRFMLLWNERPAVTDTRIGYYFNDSLAAEAPVLCYTYLDGAGQQLGPIVKTRAYLSDCQPIVTADGNVMWYTRVFGKMNFHTIKVGDLSGLKVVPHGTGGDAVLKGALESGWYTISCLGSYLYVNSDKKLELNQAGANSRFLVTLGGISMTVQTEDKKYLVPAGIDFKDGMGVTLSDKADIGSTWVGSRAEGDTFRLSSFLSAGTVLFFDTTTAADGTPAKITVGTAPQGANSQFTFTPASEPAAPPPPPPPPPPPTTGELPAVHQRTVVQVNGFFNDAATYAIGGKARFDIRDIALLLEDTDKKFNVTVDAEHIAITTNATYKRVGGESANGNTGDRPANTAWPSRAKLTVDGVEKTMPIYTVEGVAYFRLFDIAELFNFSLSSNPKDGSTIIDTTKPYK